MKKLKFALYPNDLTPDPYDLTARLLDVPNFGLEDIVAICTRPGTGMTEEMIRSAYSNIEKAVWELTSSGTVSTSLFDTGFSMPGVFYDGEGASNKYEVSVSMNPGAEVQRIARSIKLERVRPVAVQPIIDYVTDMETKVPAEALTAGQILQVKGKDLNTVPDAELEGVFLVDTNGKETALSAFRNMPSELLVKVPKGLKAGTYRLEVRSNMRTKTMRTGIFKRSFTVA